MAGEIFDFEWFVHNKGYEWLEAARPTAAGVLPGRAAGDSAADIIPWVVAAGEPSSLNLADRRKYFPLRDHSCLFRVFAETQVDPEGITAFANDYGLLGMRLDAGQGPAMPMIGTAEPVAAWESEIVAIRSALALWDMVSAGDSEALARQLSPFMEFAAAEREWEASAGGNVALLDRRAVSAGEIRWYRTHPEVAGMFAAGEFRSIALSRVQAIVNEHLGSRVSPRILWDESSKGDWGLYFVPDSLVGAIWVQFAQAITENRDYRRCRQCDSWFEIDHYKARANRYFCSNACRSKAYRERQQEARELASAGLSTGEIAERLGSDVRTVNRWVRPES